MADREAQAVTRLKTDAALVTLLPGGIYRSASLGTEGITNATATPTVYAAGLLRPTAIVKQRALIPTDRIRDLKERIADANQVLEVWLYERITSVAIEAALERIYSDLEGYALPGAWPCAWSFTLPVMPEPGSLQPQIMVARIDFTIVSIRKPVAA